MKQNATYLYADGVHSRKQLHNLANGEDRTRMAAKVFADELSRENSRKQQQGMGL